MYIDNDDVVRKNRLRLILILDFHLLPTQSTVLVYLAFPAITYSSSSLSSWNVRGPMHTAQMLSILLKHWRQYRPRRKIGLSIWYP